MPVPANIAAVSAVAVTLPPLVAALPAAFLQTRGPFLPTGVAAAELLPPAGLSSAVAAGSGGLGAAEEEDQGPACRSTSVVRLAQAGLLLQIRLQLVLLYGLGHYSASLSTVAVVSVSFSP